jgi:hypothetical protein
MKRRRRQDINIYKPNRNNNGSVAQFKIAGSDECMFLECARQVAPQDSSRPYDWEKKIIVKLGLPDISKLLFYLKMSRPQSPLKLYHESPRGGNKTVDLKYQEYKGKPGYFMSVSYQKDKGEEAHRVSVPIGMDEAEILKVGLALGIEVILGWNHPAEKQSGV